MLNTDPVLRDPPNPKKPEYTHVYEKPDRDEGYNVQGFHWGGLTAGDWKTVFWILLAPFALANVAGWTTKSHSKWAVALVRVTAIALTALFVSQAMIALVLIPYIWFGEQFTTAHAWQLKGTAIGLFAVVLALFLWLVRTSTRSHFGELSPQEKFRLLLTPKTDAMLSPVKGGTAEPLAGAQWNDPAGTVVTDPAIWGTHSIVHRLRRLHLAIGFTVVSMAASLWADNIQLLWPGIFLFGLLVISTFATSFRPRNSALLWITAVSSLTSLILAVACVAAIGWSSSPGTRMDDLHNLTFAITVVLGVSAMACVFNAGWLTVGALVIASQFGAVLGIAVGLIAEQLTRINKPVLVNHGAGFVAVAMLFLIALLVIVALILSAIPHPRSGEKGLTTLLRRIVLRAPWVFYSAAAFGIGFGVLVIFKSARRSALDASISGISEIFSMTFAKALFTGFTPKALDVPMPKGGVRDIAVTVAVVIVLLAWWRVSATIGWLRGLLVPVGAAVLVFAATKGFDTAFLGLHFKMKPGRLVDIAVFVTVLIPGLFMLKSIISGVREGEKSRRQVGILWDVGSFWPRWFHPLAPPGYGPIAVEGLQKELKTNHREVLAAHSQGKLIAAVALSQMEEDDLPDSFVTYGSQLGVLFPAMFPAAGVDALVAEVSRRFEDRWINLWRDDDPIGGQFIETIGSANWQVCTGHGHSGHEVTPEYRVARARVLAGTPTWPDDEDQPECWDSP